MEIKVGEKYPLKGGIEVVVVGPLVGAQYEGRVLPMVPCKLVNPEYLGSQSFLLSFVLVKPSDFEGFKVENQE